MMEAFINGAVEILVNIFDMYIIYRYMTIFFGDKIVNKKLAVVMYGVRFGVTFVCGAIVLPPITTSIVYLLSEFVIALCYSARLSKKVIVTIMIYMFAFVGEIIIAIFVGIGGFELNGTNKQLDALYKVIMEFIFWAITLIIQKFKNVNSNTPISKLFIIAIIVIPISSICLEYMIFKQKEVNGNMAGVSLICVLTTNFILIYLYDSLSKMFRERTRSIVMEREKEYYHDQAEMLKDQHEDLRQFRHDFNNRMVVIQQMMNTNRYDRALEYIRRLVEKINKTEEYSSTGNLVIDSVVNYKLSKIAGKGIKIITDIVLPEDVLIDDDDIVVILGNLLDNAIEASQRLNEDKYIYIDIGVDKGTMLIHMENRYDSIVYQNKGKLVTRKSDVNLHGIGLQSVSTIVEKYDGEMEIENNGEIFTVDILLYL